MARREADECHVVAVTLTHELAEVQLATRAHRGRPCVAEMRVVRPDDRLGAPVRPIEPRHEGVQRLRHVAIAQVPRLVAAPEHRPIVLLGVPNEPRVLLGGEERLYRNAAVLSHVLGRPASQVEELRDDLVFAGRP